MPFLYGARRLVALIGVACFTAMLSLSGAAAADAPDIAPAPEPLRAALQAAWQQHPTYRATEARLAAARARLDAAGQPLYNPQIDLDAEEEGPDRTATAGLSLTLDVSGKRRVRRDAASARLTVAEARAGLVRRDFIRQWFNAFFDLSAADQRVQTGERRLALLTRFIELAERQFAVGDISGLDRDVALLARDEAEAEQSRLAAEHAEASARFRTVGGDPSLALGLALPDQAPPMAIATLDEAGLQQLPEWRIAEADALAAERDVAVASRNRKTDPTIGVRGGRIDYGNVSDNIIGVSVSVPMFVRNSYAAEVVAARADAEAAFADVERTRAELAAERRRIVDTYEATRAAWSRWQGSRGTNIDKRVQLLERLWREGELSTSDYLLQLNQTLDTALAGADLEARLWRSYADYLATSGQLEIWAGLERTP